MCKGFDQSRSYDYQVLRIRAFYVRLLFSSSTNSYDSLTLHFPPRINAGPLEIDGLSIRPHTPAFLTLHRVVVTSEESAAEAVYGSRERVGLSEGLRFEIYAGDVKVLKGVVRKDDDMEEEEESWRLDCESHVQVEKEIESLLSLLSEPELCVEMEGGGHVVAVMRKRRTRKSPLEEIPEQRETESAYMDSACCCSCDGKCNDDGKAAAQWRQDVFNGGCRDECEVEVEGVGWAVDVGIWVVCLGVGYLVSKASRNHSIKRRTRRILF